MNNECSVEIMNNNTIISIISIFYFIFFSVVNIIILGCLYTLAPGAVIINITTHFGMWQKYVDIFVCNKAFKVLRSHYYLGAMKINDLLYRHNLSTCHLQMRIS